MADTQNNMNQQQRLDATQNQLIIEALTTTDQLSQELLKVRMRVAMLERANGNSQEFNRVVMEQVMVLRDLLPHADGLLEIVTAWKAWGKLPGNRLMVALIWSLTFGLIGEAMVKAVF